VTTPTNFDFDGMWERLQAAIRNILTELPEAIRPELIAEAQAQVDRLLDASGSVQEFRLRMMGASAEEVIDEIANLNVVGDAMNALTAVKVAEWKARSRRWAALLIVAALAAQP